MHKKLLYLAIFCLAQGALGMKQPVEPQKHYLFNEWALRNPAEKGLYKAAGDGSLWRVKYFLLFGPDINAKFADEDEASALFIAVSNGHADVAKLLLENGADVDTQNAWGLTPLFIAAAAGHVSLVKTLLPYGPDLNRMVIIDDEEELPEVPGSPLLIASSEGYDEIVKLLLEQGADPNVHDQSGVTPLMLAAGSNHFDVALLLLQYNANPNMQAEIADNMSALMVAAQEGHLGIVQLLLTTISHADAQIIRNNITGFLAMQRMQLKSDINEPWQVKMSEKPIHEPSRAFKPVRQLITKHILDQVIDERMERATHMMALQDSAGRTARDIALENHENLIAYLLDPEEHKAQQRIRTMIEANVRHVLFAPRSNQ